MCTEIVDGNWGNWYDWICTDDTLRRSRYCNQPSPRYGGKNCNGNDNEIGAKCESSKYESSINLKGMEVKVARCGNILFAAYALTIYL